MKFTDNLRSLIDAHGIDGALAAIDQMLEDGEGAIEDLSESIKAELGYAGD